METLYDQDFYRWTQESAQLLREGRFAELDIDNLVEEVESMGRSEKRGFVSRLAVLMAHLLKWQYQPGRRTRSRLLTIRAQRLKVASILKDNPSFKHLLHEMIDEAYQETILSAMNETGLDEEVFPSSYPYTFDQMMDKAFLPGEK